MDNKTLNQQCAAVRDEFMAGLPAPQKDTMMAAGQRLAESDVARNVTSVGDAAPDFSLKDTGGREFLLSEARLHGPIVLSFYRGGWCPFCNLELKALADREAEMRNLGARLVAVSPELHEQNQAAAGDLNLPFALLFDEANHVARQYGLVMQVDETVRPLYQQWGFDLPTFNGDDSWELPLPGTFIIDSDGTVCAAYVNKDYTQRMEPDAIIAALKTLGVTKASQQ
jgi:peroxiredoxin